MAAGTSSFKQSIEKRMPVPSDLSSYMFYHFAYCFIIHHYFDKKELMRSER